VSCVDNHHIWSKREATRCLERRFARAVFNALDPIRALKEVQHGARDGEWVVRLQYWAVYGAAQPGVGDSF
jgi:hypothetical protein